MLTEAAVRSLDKGQARYDPGIEMTLAVGTRLGPYEISAKLGDAMTGPP